ncbi:MAG: tRNA(Ile)(2)-agmatinylcytidine synthase [Thermoplasmatota archaeon]
MIPYHIGIDSTDSAELGMCTTYLGAVLMERLSPLPLELSTFPELIRLNPNVPWKTRGNGAVCLRYQGEKSVLNEVIDTAEAVIEDMSIFQDPQTNPGLAILQGNVSGEVNELYHRALHRIVDVEDAEHIGKRSGVYVKGWKNERGLIGALSAIGAELPHYTYEAIQYRPGSIKVRERKVDIASLLRASSNHPATFFNVDGEGKPVCIPHSPCPVILGIRGTDPKDTLEALREVRAENVERWVLWRTNQHTDAHIEEVEDISGVSQYSSVRCPVVITGSPAYIKGGHLMVSAEDHLGNSMDLAAYEPTKGFRKELADLAPGDRVEVWGSIRTDDVPRITVNLEKIMIVELAEITRYENPRCPKCGGPTASMGKGQGLRCKMCRYRGADLIPIEISLPRNLEKGLIEPPPDAWRHLFRPSSIPDHEKRTYEAPFWGTGRP